MFSLFNPAFIFSKSAVLSLMIGFIPLLGFGQGSSDESSNAPVPYTLADRERLIKLEVQVAALQNDVSNLRADMNTLRGDINTLRGDVNTLRSDMMLLFMWGFGLVFSAIIGLVGFIIWDRRSSNQKITQQVQANKTRLESIERKLVFKP